MNGSLEHTLAFHCAPALAGIKPSNLICCDLARYRSLDRELLELNRQLNPAACILGRYAGAAGACCCLCTGAHCLNFTSRSLTPAHF